MSIPSLTQYGLLPSGVHTCSLTEAIDLFVTNPRRERLWEQFLAFTNWLGEQGIEGPLWAILNGSFTTSKLEPQDIDVVIELENGEPWLISRAVDIFSTHRVWIKQEYEIDFFINYSSLPPNENMVEFFQYVRELTVAELGIDDPSIRKGLLRVQI